MTTVQDLLDAFPGLLECSSGDLSFNINDVQPAPLATEHSLVFASTDNQLNGALKSPAQVIVTDKDTNDSEKIILKTKNPYLAMAKCLDKFFPNNWFPNGTPEIHKSANVSEKAKIGNGVHIGANVTIHPNTEIGDNCIIRENSVIEMGSKIGENSHLFPFSFIGRNSILGNECVIQSFTSIGSEGFGYAANEKNQRTHIPHKGRVVLADRVEIGANVTIDRGTFGETFIDEDTKIDNQSHIGHNCRIGKRCVMAGGFLMAGSSQVGDDFLAGGHCSIGGHVKITDGVTFATTTQSMVSIDKPGVYGGLPVQSIGTYKKNLLTIGKLAEMRRQVSKLMKEVFKED